MDARTLGFALVVSAALSACEREPGAGGDTGPPLVDDLPVLAVDEEVRLGSTDDPGAGFSFIGDVLVDQERRTYVAELQAREIRVFDESGRPVRTIGREGEGPGEFSSLSRLRWVGDTLWAPDVGNLRINLILTDGTLAGTIPIQPKTGTSSNGTRYMVWPYGYRADGRLDGQIAVGGYASVTVPRYVFDRSGALVDSLGTMTIVNVAPPEDSLDFGGMRMYGWPQPRSHPVRNVTVLGDTVTLERRVAPSDARATFTVTRVAATGDTVYRRSYAYRPIPVSSTWGDSVLADIVGDKRMPGAEGLADAVRTLTPIEDRFPAVGGRDGFTVLFAAEAGSVWLRRDGPTAPTSRWVVLAPDGEPRGVVDLPWRARPRWAEGDLVWVEEPDQLDVPWLVRYRLEDG